MEHVQHRIAVQIARCWQRDSKLRGIIRRDTWIGQDRLTGLVKMDDHLRERAEPNSLKKKRSPSIVASWQLNAVSCRIGTLPNILSARWHGRAGQRCKEGGFFQSRNSLLKGSNSPSTRATMLSAVVPCWMEVCQQCPLQASGSET